MSNNRLLDGIVAGPGLVPATVFPVPGDRVKVLPNLAGFALRLPWACTVIRPIRLRFSRGLAWFSPDLNSLALMLSRIPRRFSRTRNRT
ncbi:hypothetical protein [Methylocaldum szegediense]|uniref:Uncharacterized protein n=1 Tax=Methylocaldum szegediense TaxID=73780 RepID=A0ABN8X865_9GAMM|nr:hypothetical protein [Methylocaldum szegediense]CAI8894332.1 protein of unknown function [Methylocaldum szegediense]